MIGANIGVSMPVFWLGLLLAYVFALVLKGTPFAIAAQRAFIGWHVHRFLWQKPGALQMLTGLKAFLAGYAFQFSHPEWPADR